MRFILSFCVCATAIASAQEPVDVAFTAAVDGSEQRYVMIKPDGFEQQEQRDMLLALHGHGSDRWQFATADIGETKAARDVAQERKMLYVCPDYRAKTSWMGPKAEADVVQIINDLRQQFSLQRVFLCGGSMGGSSCLTFAALHPELVDGVASMNGTANHLEYEKYQDAIHESFGGTQQQIPLEYKNRSAEYWPERLTMPIGVTAHALDESVPPQSVMRLAGILQKLGRPVLLIHREDQGHSTTYEDARAIIEFAMDNAETKAPTQ